MSIENITQLSSKDDLLYVIDVIPENDPEADLCYTFDVEALTIERLQNYQNFLNKIKESKSKEVLLNTKDFNIFKNRLEKVLEQYKNGEKEVDNSFTAQDLVVFDKEFDTHTFVDSKKYKKTRN